MARMWNGKVPTHGFLEIRFLCPFFGALATRGEEGATPVKLTHRVHVHRWEIPHAFEKGSWNRVLLFFSPSNHARNAVHREKHHDEMHPHHP